ncbi:hypothetical protein STEG23_008712 [Scotinomys teguina]
MSRDFSSQEGGLDRFVQVRPGSDSLAVVSQQKLDASQAQVRYIEVHSIQSGYNLFQSLVFSLGPPEGTGPHSYSDNNAEVV